MAAPFAEPSAVAVQLNTTFDEGTTAQVRTFLRHASALIRRVVPTVDSDLADGSLQQDLVEMVVTQVAMRRMASSGLGLLSEQYPEYQYTLSPDAARGFALTDEEESWLKPRSSGGRAFSIVPG